MTSVSEMHIVKKQIDISEPESALNPRVFSVDMDGVKSLIRVTILI